MTDFTEYKKNKIEIERERRESLLQKLNGIDVNLAFGQIEKEEGIDKSFLERQKEKELSKISDVQSEIKEEQLSILARWKKTGFNVFNGLDE